MPRRTRTRRLTIQPLDARYAAWNGQDPGDANIHKPFFMFLPGTWTGNVHQTSAQQFHTQEELQPQGNEAQLMGGTLDAPINGLPAGSTGVTGASYTNSFSAAPVTTLYTLDPGSHTLFIQNAPNSGTQTAGLPVTLSGAPLQKSLAVLVNSSIEHYGPTTRAALPRLTFHAVRMPGMTVGTISTLNSIHALGRNDMVISNRSFDIER